MAELYLETPDGNVPIDPQFIERYNLQQGTRSPFSRNRIVGKNGEYFIDPESVEDIREHADKRVPYDGFHDDGIDEMDNGFAISTSEIIDFSQGVDSEN